MSRRMSFPVWLARRLNLVLPSEYERMSRLHWDAFTRMMDARNSERATLGVLEGFSVTRADPNYPLYRRIGAQRRQIRELEKRIKILETR